MINDTVSFFKKRGYKVSKCCLEFNMYFVYLDDSIVCIKEKDNKEIFIEQIYLLNEDDDYYKTCDDFNNDYSEFEEFGF